MSSGRTGRETRGADGRQRLLGAGLLSLGLLALAGCNRSAEAQTAAPAPPPPEVTVAQPVVRPIEEFSEHTGRFVPLQDVEVRPRVSGYLQRVHFTDGQSVRQGQLLFTLDPLPLKARADRSAADVAQAEARLVLARSEFQRAETLIGSGAISRELHENRREAVNQAEAVLAAANAAHRADNLELSYTRVYAPISGRISDRRVDAGNLVQAGQTVLTRIVSLDPIHFEFAVSEGLLAGDGGPQISRQAPRQVAVQLEGESGFNHIGRVDFLDNQIQAGTGTVRVRAVFSGTGGRFTPGQFARVRVLTPASAPAVLIPDSAVNTDQSRKFVLVVNAKNVAEYRPVVLGPLSQGLRVVRQGLAPTDRIMINGLQRAFPGQPVTPKPGRIEVTTAEAPSAPNAG